MCFSTPRTKHASCGDIPSVALEASTGVLVLGILLWNGTVIIVALSMKSETQDANRSMNPYKLHVVGLHVSNIVICVYLLIITCTDLHFKSDPIFFDTKWGMLCSQFSVPSVQYLGSIISFPSFSSMTHGCQESGDLCSTNFSYFNFVGEPCNECFGEANCTPVRGQVRKTQKHKCN